MSFAILKPALVALTLIVTLASPAPAFESPAPEQTEETLRVARERWNTLSPAEKERLHERYESYCSLSSEERTRIDRRARRMQKLARGVVSELPRDVKTRLDGLAPEKRKELVTELVEAEVSERWERIREKMPSDLVENIESLPAEDRERALHEFKHTQRDRVCRHAIDHIGRRLGMERAEIEALRNLPVEERMSKVLELRRQLSIEDKKEHGLPAGMTPEQWKELESLPPEEFFETMARFRSARTGESGQGGERSSEKTADSGRRRKMHGLLRALRPQKDELLERSHLPKEERKAEVDRLRRQRSFEVIRTEGLFEPAEVQALEALTDQEYLQSMRRLIRKHRGGHGGDSRWGSRQGRSRDPGKSGKSGRSGERRDRGPRRRD